MGFYENEEDAFLPLRDVVFKQLREEILYGKLKPGERLMEIALSERLGVSRTPVREGIRLLEKEGLVVMLPRRGALPHPGGVPPQPAEQQPRTLRLVGRLRRGTKHPGHC